jgi:hypothetical protein
MTDSPERTYAFPSVLLAKVPCPIDGCDREIDVYARLLVAEGEERGLAAYRLGTALNASDVEMHLVEHGMDISGGAE